MRIKLFLFLFLFSCLQCVAVGKTLLSHDLFERSKEGVIQVSITNVLSGEQSSIGSGFFVSELGEIITNYHVVSSAVQKDDSYTVEGILSDGTRTGLAIISFDIINDLALLKAEHVPSQVLRLNDQPLKKGMPVASLGNPRDMGMTIVNGSYSGLLEDTLYEKIHFSGSINPGMSGGPALNQEGEVIGINVATSGNAISFLVPSKFAIQLLNRDSVDGAPVSFTELIRRQLLENQTNFMSAVLSEPVSVTGLGDYLVPDKLAPFMKCWGDSDRDQKQDYVVVTKVCSTDNEVYLDRGYSTGNLYFEHKYISSESLNTFRFYNLYQSFYQQNDSPGGREEDYTKFDCETDFVKSGGLNLKVALCMRGHKKFRGIYDVILKAASLDKERSGIQTSVLLTGVSYENAVSFTEKYLKAVSWKQE